jgi:isopentenyldiphosphate isomerase
MSDFELTVDVDDNPIGSKHWRDMQYDDIYRVSALWLTDTETDDVLLAQRKWTKKNDPGKWDTAVAGTVEANETYEGNIVKEIEEEIGLTGLKLVTGPKTFTDDGNHKFFCQWFLGSIDKAQANIKIQEEEVEAVKWVPISWLLDDLKQNPQSYTPSTPENLEALGVS